MINNDHEKEPEYSDLILVDLLHLDWRNLFRRYRTDLIGFLVFLALMLLIIAITYWLKSIGSGVV